MPLAVAFDLSVVLPVAYFLGVLRPARRPALDAARVVGLGALLAGLLLAGRPEAAAALRWVGVLAELAVLSLLARRLRTAATELGGVAGDDVLARVGRLSDPLLRLAGAELAVLYYAFVAPRVRQSTGPDEFSYTERSGLAALLLGLAMVVAVEGLVAHLLLPRGTARWLLAAADGYALVWLVAAFQAARLRPVAVAADMLLVRTSLLWTVEVPLAAIEAVTSIDHMPRSPGVLRAALGAAPVLLITLAAPLVARGPVGLRRSVRQIALYVDEPARLRARLGR